MAADPLDPYAESQPYASASGERMRHSAVYRRVLTYRVALILEPFAA